MYNLIESNKRRSWVLMAAFAAIIVALAWAISIFVEESEIVLVAGFVFSLFSVLTGYYAGDKMILASVGAKEVPKEADPELFRIVENLAITAGIPMPKVYLIPDAALNAFATGRDPEHASVAITTGLRQALSKPELEAVMGHELSHVKNYDIRIMLLAAVLCGMVVFIGDLLWRGGMRSGSNRSRDKSSAGAALMVVAVLAIILSPIAAQLIKLAISRRREFLADASSVMLTRYPEAMISALEKISQAPQIAGHNEAIAHLFIFPPFAQRSFWSNLFSTHPPLPERIAVLKNASSLR